MPCLWLHGALTWGHRGVASVPANIAAVTACAWCGNVDTSRLEEQRQEGGAGELKAGALRWWRLLNENWNNGEQKQTLLQGTGSTWENLQEHQTSYCTRPVQCVSSGLNSGSPFYSQLKWWKSKMWADDKIMTQATTDLNYSAKALGTGWVAQSGTFLTFWHFQAIDDWLANKPHTGNVKLISCHACWGKNAVLRRKTVRLKGWGLGLKLPKQRYSHFSTLLTTLSVSV